MNKTTLRLFCALAYACLATASGLASAQSDPEHAHDHEHDDHPVTETIVVTASPLAHTRDELASPVEVITRDKITSDFGSTLGETLARIPGIATSGFASGASRPVIRGQDAFRTEVLEDGLTTHDVSRLSPDHGIPVNPLAARAIEVVRGPSTLRYGGGAAAGVVNTITGRVPKRMPSETTGEVLASYGHNDDEATAAAVLDGGIGDFAWHLDGVFTDANDYDSGGGDRQRGTSRRGGTGAIGGAWIGEAARVGFGYTHFTNEYGIPGDEDVAVDMDTNRYRFEVDIDEPFAGAQQLRVRGVYSNYEHVERSDDTIAQRFDNDEFEGRVELLHEPIGGLHGALGFTARHADFKAGGEAAEFLSPAKTRTFAVYAFEETALGDSLTVEAGLRVESTQVEGTPLASTRRSENFVPLSGSLRLVADPFDDWTLGLTAAASQRAPSSSELFASGPHEATGTFEIGDADLDEETSFTGELRVSGEVGPLRLESATFITRYDDYIFGRRTGVFCDDGGCPVGGGDLEQLVYEARDALFYGAELSLEADLAEFEVGSLIVDGQFDWVRARFQRGADRDVPRVTPIRWGGGLSIEGEMLRGRIGFLRTETQKDIAAEETKTDGFTTIDLSLGIALDDLLGGHDVELQFNARNVNDVKGRNHIAFNKDEIAVRGRNLRVGLIGRF